MYGFGVNDSWELLDLEVTEMPGLCVVMEGREGGSPVPKLVAQPHGAAVYAAAWRDRAGRVLEWLELWVQDVRSWHLDGNQPLMSPTNTTLDKHWELWVETLLETDGEGVILLDWEKKHPEAIWLSPDGTARLRQDGRWELCKDDAFLRKERLASYSDTLERYLWNGDEENPKMVAVTPEAPQGRLTKSREEIFGEAIPLNPDGGLMLLRRASAVRYDDFVDLLSGAETATGLRECLWLPVAGANARLLDRPGLGGKAGGFFFSRNQIPGHLGELLHLKLLALRGAFAAVQAAVRQGGTPFLGIRADGFGVSLVEPDGGMPYLWNHRVRLAACPQAVRTELGVTKEPCFVPFGEEESRSIYRSLQAEGEVKGDAKVRVRRVSEPDDDGLVVVEGSLLTDEPLNAGKLDLLGIEWLSRKSGRLKLFAKMEGNPQDGAGEYRFSSLQTKLPEELAEAFAGGGQSTLSSDRVRFHLLPRLGTPCDLYSLGVLGLRTLIAGGGGRALAEVLDDLLKMARIYRSRFTDANWHTGTTSLNEFVKTGEGGAWAEKLGPHRLVRGEAGITSADAFREIPAPLWWEVMEFVARLFPGEALGSFCKGYDDFSPRALDEVFTEPLAVLDSLVARSRELLFGNPVTNRELLGVIRAARGRR